MSSLFFMVTITDRRSTDAFLQLYESHGVDVSLRTVGSGTAVQETLSTLGLERTEKAVLMAVVTEETGRQPGGTFAGSCASTCRAPASRSPCR